jgi:hypothetical protein
LGSKPPTRAADSAAQRFKNSALMRSRFSPLATPTMNGRVFDQLAAVRASLSTASSVFCKTGLLEKSRVDRRDAMNAETARASTIGFGFMAQIYPQIQEFT